MDCSFCHKSASQINKRTVCDCCLVHLGSCDLNAKKSVPIVWEEDAVRKVECYICLEEYQEDEKQQHRKLCRPRMVFRCSLCDEDYLTEESVWNHLIGHQIALERKHLFYQKMRLTYKQYECILCTDRRSYRESCYWQHVHEEHDGFYLRCSGCGETFRSKKSKADHDDKNCKGEQKDKGADKNVIEKECNKEVLQPRVENDAQCPHCEKKCSSAKVLARHIECCHLPASCDICGLSFSTSNKAFYHKKRHHSKLTVQCPTCLRPFRNEYSLRRHLEGFHQNIEAQTVYLDSQQTDETKVLWNLKTNCPIRWKRFSEHGENTKKRASCTACRMVFANEDALNNHQCSICPYCSKGCYNHKRLITHIEMRHALISCDVCEVRCYGKRTFWNHKLRAHSKPKYKCLQCSEKFYYNSEYKRHIPSCVKVKLKCKLCDRKFNSSSSVTAHMRECHGVLKKPQKDQPERDDNKSEDISDDKEASLLESHDLKPQEQSENENTEGSSSKLSQVKHSKNVVRRIKLKHGIHRQLSKHHAIGFAFPCKFCERIFKSSVHVRKHMKQVHSQDNMLISPELKHTEIPVEETNTKKHESSEDLESLVKCELCGKDVRKIVLTRHINDLHKERNCKVCAMPFQSKRQLQYHMMICHSEPKHKCPHCPKKYYEKRSFLNHMKKHKCHIFTVKRVSKN